MNVRISEIKNQSLESLEGKWRLTVLLTFIVFLMTAVLPLILKIILSGGFTSMVDQNNPHLGAMIFQFVYSIALVPFTIAFTWFYLNLIRREEPEIPQVFSIYLDGQTSLKLIGASILQNIMILLWTILLIIPGIIKKLSYSQTFYLLKDHPEYSVIQAITESKNRMKGYKWKYFLLNLSFIGWGILCVISLGIGYLLLVPYVSTSTATFYRELIAPQDRNDSSPKQIDLTK